MSETVKIIFISVVFVIAFVVALAIEKYLKFKEFIYVLTNKCGRCGGTIVDYSAKKAYCESCGEDY